MAKFRFVIDIEAPKYKGPGDFPPHVHASEILFEMIKDARTNNIMAQMKAMIKKGENEPETDERYMKYLKAKGKTFEKIEKSYVENDKLVTEIIEP